MFAMVLVIDGNVEGAKDKEPASIKTVMAKAHKGKGNLLSKVTAGTASEDEKKMLVSLYTDLAANKNPKGDDADWKTRTEGLVKAAKADDVPNLKKFSDCKGCHSEHK